MKNKQVLILILFILLCIFIIVSSTSYLITELKKMSVKDAPKYETIKSEEVKAMADSERLELVNKYTLVNTDEFSIDALYDLLSEEYLNNYKTLESFEKYINDSIIKNIDIGSDYLNVQKKSQDENDGVIETEYVINVYTSEEYIKLFDYESDIIPNIKFSYNVLLIESVNNYSFEIWS